MLYEVRTNAQRSAQDSHQPYAPLISSASSHTYRARVAITTDQRRYIVFPRWQILTAPPPVPSTAHSSMETHSENDFPPLVVAASPAISAADALDIGPTACKESSSGWYPSTLLLRNDILLPKRDVACAHRFPVAGGHAFIYYSKNREKMSAQLLQRRPAHQLLREASDIGVMACRGAVSFI